MDNIINFKLPKLIDIARPILCFYNLMLTIFAFLMLVYEYSYMDKCKCKCRKLFATSKLFLFLVMMHQSLRLLFNFIPLKFYVFLYKSGSWGLAAQNILDLTPEILFVLTYTTILLSWIEFFIYLFLVVRKNKITKSSGVVNLPFFGVLVLGSLMFVVVFAESIVIGIFPGLCKDYYTLSRIQGITLSATSITFSASFFFLYLILFLAFCPMRKVWGMSETSALRKTLLVITLTAFLYFIFLIFRMVWILILNDLLKGWVKTKTLDEWVFHVAWILYMCTEEIPMTLMLVLSYVFRTLLGSNKLKLKEAIKIMCFRLKCLSCCYSCIWGDKYQTVISQIPELAINTETTETNQNSAANHNDPQNPQNKEIEANNQNENENENFDKNSSDIDSDPLDLNHDKNENANFLNGIEREHDQIASEKEWLSNLYLNVKDIKAADDFLEQEKKNAKKKK